VDPHSKARPGTYTLVLKVPQVPSIKPLTLPFAFTNNRKLQKQLEELRHRIEVREMQEELCCSPDQTQPA
jgi:hypothetical protein